MVTYVNVCNVCNVLNVIVSLDTAKTGVNINNFFYDFITIYVFFFFRGQILFLFFFS